MSKWDQLWAEFPGDESPEFPEWLVNVKTKGDEMQKENVLLKENNRRFLDHAEKALELCRTQEDKLEAIRVWALNLRQHGREFFSLRQVSYADQILELLGDE